jgi:hypothetical protein
LAIHPLRLGLSVSAKISTRDHYAAPLAPAAQGAFAAEEPEDAGPAIETRITQIISENRQ